VLFVGDSYTFGSCVPVAGTFGEQTAAALRARGRAAFAINAGVPAYNSEQQLAWLTELLPRFRPHHVVLGFVMNDAEPIAGLPTPLDEVYGGTWSWLAVDLRQAANALGRWCVDDRPLFASARPTYEADYRRSWGPGSPKVARCREAVLAMHRLCRDHGVGFTCAVLPDFTRAFDATYPYSGIHEQVLAWGQAAGFTAVDTLVGLRGADAAALRVPGDGHPTAEGHRRMAEQVAAVLAEQWRD
jgi:lysophospholipase L1-like esterase